MPDPPGSSSALRTRAARGAVKPEIQALRAVAVLLVLAYHVAPKGLPGGYVGVDVFFVISGFLITAHIVKPLRRGTLTVGGFYARRAVRLLPASMLVLLVTLVSTWLFVPRSLWPQFGRQIAASALYVENWVLAGNATDYSAPAADVSPVQHFWSLSAEEQFYLAWPALLIVGSIVAARWRRWRRAYLAVLAPLALASLTWSVLATAGEPASAYFITTTRAWEFAAGGILWLVVHRAATLPDPVRAAGSWAGAGLIAAAAFAFSSRTPFPGWAAAVPVLGAVLVLAAGLPRARWSPSGLMGWKPVQAVGDMSYSLYLWHWPLIVLLPFVAGAQLGLEGRVVAVLVAVPLAYLTRRFVEIPVLDAYRPTGGAFWRRKSTVGLAVATGMVLVAVPAFTMNTTVRHQQTVAWDTLERVVASPPACFGAAAVDDPACAASADDDPTDAVYPAPLIGDQDDFGVVHRGCQVGGDTVIATPCTFGDPDGTVKVALVGDSHAAQWEPALAAVAEQRGWQLTTYLRSGCPVTATPPQDRSAACRAWEKDVIDTVEHGDFDYVFTSALSATHYGGDGGVEGFVDAWTRMGGSGARVVALRDNPDPTQAGVQSTPACVEDRSAEACGTSQDVSLLPDPQVSAVEETPGAALVDLTGYFCQDGTCPAVIGDVLVYHQDQHVTMTYMTTLAPMLSEAIDEAVGPVPGS
ncbi:acyltransferase family protein [Cellulomonas sp.]|uniref:acyltransferase family protein n=1 Tax=Cellulomonas sp. TaxID=40001 RepID=UPI001B202013|nr:acyltransferase family protein [Cellulomonas sp.]MBO9553262.1 acyltransferase [Cellulomonas sp.]